MAANEAECAAAGLDPREVSRIAAGLSRYARQAQKLGITVFGGSGTGSLRIRDENEARPLLLAFLDGNFDGGDGGGGTDENGLMRGE